MKQQHLITVDTQLATPAQIAADRRQQRDDRRAQLRDILDAIYAEDYGSNEKEMWSNLWSEQMDQWLQQLPSQHTRRAYRRSVAEFRSYLWEQYAIRYLWMVEAHQAIAWIDYMRTVGSAQPSDNGKPWSDRTINLRLAALSSFYHYMTGATRLVGGDQVGLFVSADGYPRQNPFRSTRVKRPKVIPYGHSNPVPTAAMQWILRRLANKPNKTIADRRDYALLLLFYRTGYRADSSLRMRWGDLQPRTDGEGMTYMWKGKGGKERRKALPARVWNAIKAYLGADGRYIPGVIQPDDEMYIWQGVRGHGNRNLAVQRFLADGHEPEVAQALANQYMAEKEKNKPIAQSTANEMLRRHLTRYFKDDLHKSGVDVVMARGEAKRLANQYHLHSLRHAFANELDQASGGDVRMVSETLDHSSLETTRTYLESIRDPEDKATDLLERQFGL